MKNYKGLISGAAFVLLNTFMFGFMPIAMICHAIVSFIGEGINLISSELDSKWASVIGATILLLLTSVFFVIKMHRSKKSFDWMVALLITSFVLLNGIGFKFSEIYNINFTDGSWEFLSKISVYYIWIYLVIGLYHDLKIAPKNNPQA